MNTDKDLISVIIPVYGVEQYLDQCIQSIADQTYYNLEILLVDDGSPDQCPQICDSWAEKDPRIIAIHKENGGVSRARNIGIEAAKGRFIVFVDSDDYLEPEYIEYLYQAHLDTGADISECRYTRDQEPEEKKGSVRPGMLRPVLQTPEEALWIWSHPDHEELNLVIWNKMYRRELVGELRFEEGIGGGEDVLFTCYAFGKSRKIARIDNKLYHWRDRPGSASKKFPGAPLESAEMLLLAVKYLGQDYPAVSSGVKFNLCHLMNGFFYTLRYEADVSDEQEVREKMLSFRRQIHFTAEEWSEYQLKQKIVIICSNTFFVGFYIRLRHFLGKAGMRIHWKK